MRNNKSENIEQLEHKNMTKEEIILAKFNIQ